MVATSRAPAKRPAVPARRPAQPMRCQPTAPQSALLRPSRRCSQSRPQNSPEDRRGRLRGTKVVSRYPRNHVPVRLQRHVSEATALLQAAPVTPSSSPHSPTEPLTATAHLGHPGSRCDIASHPDCRATEVIRLIEQELAKVDDIEAPTTCQLITRRPAALRTYPLIHSQKTPPPRTPPPFTATVFQSSVQPRSTCPHASATEIRP